MRLTIVGCGDAFHTGGRLHSAYLLDAGDERLLVDCGATTVFGLIRAGIDTSSIPRIVISHLHGDHFAGVVFFLMHCGYVARRTAPLDVYGPPGIAARVTALVDVMYAENAGRPWPFRVNSHEMHAGQPTTIGGFAAHAFEVDHPSGAPSHALRLEGHGKVFAFTGDTTWCDALIEAGRSADLYLMECGVYARASRMHLNWITIEKYLDLIGARRTILTHMSGDMLANRRLINDARIAFAEDGAVHDF